MLDFSIRKRLVTKHYIHMTLVKISYWNQLELNNQYISCSNMEASFNKLQYIKKTIISKASIASIVISDTSIYSMDTKLLAVKVCSIFVIRFRCQIYIHRFRCLQ